MATIHRLSVFESSSISVSPQCRTSDIMLPCFPRCIFYECAECVKTGSKRAVALLQSRKKIPTAELLVEMSTLFKEKSGTEMNLFMAQILNTPAIFWRPDAPEYCHCAIYYALELLKTTDDLVEIKQWLAQNQLQPSIECAVVESAKTIRSIFIIRKSGKWHAKRSTILNAYDKSSLEAAINRKRIQGVSIRNAASEYNTAYADLFLSDNLFVKRGHVWHCNYAPVPPPELFGALTPLAPEHTLR